MNIESTQEIADIANEELHRRFPVLGESHYTSSDVVFILKAYIKFWYLNHPKEEK